jgi:hypothetical protein
MKGVAAGRLQVAVGAGKHGLEAARARGKQGQVLGAHVLACRGRALANFFINLIPGLATGHLVLGYVVYLNSSFK